MNVLLWVCQAVLALLCVAGGAYKVVSYENLAQMPATAELSRFAWSAFGLVEIACGILLIVPIARRRIPALMSIAAAVLVVESLVLAALYARHSVHIAVSNPLVWVIAIALIAAVVAYGRYPSRSPA
jgi:hypothetical protein